MISSGETPPESETGQFHRIWLPEVLKSIRKWKPSLQLRTEILDHVNRTFSPPWRLSRAGKEDKPRGPGPAPPGPKRRGRDPRIFFQPNGPTDGNPFALTRPNGSLGPNPTLKTGPDIHPEESRLETRRFRGRTGRRFGAKTPGKPFGNPRGKKRFPKNLEGGLGRESIYQGNPAPLGGKFVGKKIAPLW